MSTHVSPTLRLQNMRLGLVVGSLPFSIASRAFCRRIGSSSGLVLPTSARGVRGLIPSLGLAHSWTRGFELDPIADDAEPADSSQNKRYQRQHHYVRPLQQDRPVGPTHTAHLRCRRCTALRGPREIL